MKRLFLNKSHGYVLATLFFLVFLGACYFFIYLPANEMRVEEQRFRTLQNIDRNIHEKIENSELLLNNLFADYNSNTQAYLTAYTKNYSREKFILSPIIKIPANNKKQLRDSIDSAANLVVNDATKQITLFSRKQVILSNDTSIIQGSVMFSFKQFIEYLLPDAVFDEYIVFSKGNTVYESFPSGISNAREDSLLSVRNGVGGSYVKDITIGGKDYKLFLQPVTFNSTNKWILGGLLSKNRYQKERSQLPAPVILLMVTLVLCMIVIFPWIKLYQMGSKDRLTFVDCASSIVVSMLLTSLLFFCFFKYNAVFKSDLSPDSKKTLAAEISKAFYDETKKIYGILNAYDTIRGNKIIKNIVNLNKPNIAFADTSLNKVFANSDIDSNTKKSLHFFKDSADIKEILWLDGKGDEKYNWTSDTLNAPHRNFKSRRYFDNIIKGKAYYLNGDTSKRFFLDQVVSWTSGTFTSVLAKPSNGPAGYVAAVSFTMQSVCDPVLPTGFSFAIIDNKGKVLYHSLKSRNLNENLKSEFSDSANIGSYIDARAEGEFNTTYYSKSYSVRITPLNNLPYFIVVFSDVSYEETRDIEIYSFTFSMLMLFFAFIVFKLCITFLLSSRRSIFRKQQINTSWIGPNSQYHNEYILSCVINVGIILLLIVRFKQTSFLLYLFLLLFAVTFISLFLNGLLARRYLRDKIINKYKYKMRAVWWLLIMLVIINKAAFSLLEGNNFLRLFIIEMVAITAGGLLVWYSNRLSSTIERVLPAKTKYIRSFSLMMLTGLIITSGIPVAFFYITSYDYEQNLGIRHRQTDYAHRLLDQRQLRLGNEGNPGVIYDTTGIYYDSTWISALPVVTDYNSIDKKATDSHENLKTRKILGSFRLPMGDKTVKTDKLYIPYAVDTSVIYQPLLINTNPDSVVFTYRKTPIANKYLKLSSFKLNYVIPALFRGERAFWYWLFLIAALVVFYFIIINIIKKLFCLNLPELGVWKELDDKILTDDKVNERLFIIGLPGTGKKDDVIKKITDADKSLFYNPDTPESNSVLVGDLINIPDKGAAENNEWKNFKETALGGKCRLVILNHFEYKIQDEYTNLVKLDLLEQIMQKGNCKIFVLSTIHPLVFLDSLNEKKADTTSKKDDNSPNIIHDMERWTLFLGHYYIIVWSLAKRAKMSGTAARRQLCSETHCTNFLRSVEKVTLDLYSEEEEDEDEEVVDALAYKLQVTAYYHYMNIWQSLTKEEKFLLYDLAEDNLVNSYDDANLTMLIAKGLIIQPEGSPRLFNRGFRNFILTAIGTAEAMKIKDRIKENSNWGNVRIPLMLVILAMLSFLLISQEEAYSKLLTYVGILSVGVPAVLKIFSLFDNPPSNSNT